MQQAAASFGLAFMRRGQRAEQALRSAIDQLGRQRDALLDMVRLRLAVVAALIGEDWERLHAFLSPADAAALMALHADLRPRLQGPLDRTADARPILNALRELRESMLRFDRRWKVAVATADLRETNRLREEYNRYYVFEKECAVGSPHIARQDFVRLKPLLAEDLHSFFPMLNAFDLLESP